jgi:predicted DNA-binding antitoxin AbrB/MazE fold protein
MQIQFRAVYENGVFRPLEPLPLEEHQLVTITSITVTEPMEKCEPDDLANAD